jgi:hypothetical protein
MSEADPQPQGNFQASSLVVPPRPNEFGFPLREDEFQILREGAVGDDRAYRDLCTGFLVGAVVGLIGVLATVDWGTIWQPEKRGPFLFWVALLLLIIAASATGVIICQLRLCKTRTNSPYARLTQKISTWFTAQQTGTRPNPLVPGLAIVSARYGAGALWRDVADLLEARIQNGKLHIPVTNNELQADPAPNVPKSVEVEYTNGGKSYSKTVPEGQILSIPET